MAKTRILVVEDEIIIAMEIAERLRSMGYDVVRIVADGEMAIKTSLEEHPDLILMDIMIQGNIDGIETAQRIRKQRNIPVIYLTANADDSTLERAKSSDAFGYLIKPFEENELNTTIEMALYKHRMELKLKENEERFKSLVENSSIGIFRLSNMGSFLLANKTLLNLLGFEHVKELVGKPFKNFIVDGEAQFNEFLTKLKSSRKINRYTLKLKSIDHNELYVSIGANIVSWEGEDLFIDGTIEDITVQKRYEQELIKAKEKAEESDRLKTEFLAGMSHEIRTPVNTIMSYLSLLRSELNSEGNNPYQEIFDAIQVGSLRLTRTIDSILNMAQLQAGTFDVFKNIIDIDKEVLQKLVDEFKYTSKQRGLELIYINNASHTKILGDSYSLTQLFANLIDNALKYTREGSVEIKTYNNDDGLLCVDVEDTGIGISEEFLPTLFQPFRQEEQGYTRKFDGNGLGLALVKKYCSINDAAITVKSEKGIGTTFTVKFTGSTNKGILKEKELNSENS